MTQDANTLEWAAQWTEGSLAGETNERVIEFGNDMAMTLRAAAIDKEDHKPATDTQADYRAHLKQCRICHHGLCDEGRRLWETSGRQPAEIATADIGSEPQAAPPETCSDCYGINANQPVNLCARHAAPPERVNTGTPPSEIWVHPWRETLYYSPTDQPDYISYTRTSTTSTEIEKLRELAYVPQFVEGDDELTYRDYAERLLRQKIDLKAATTALAEALRAHKVYMEDNDLTYYVNDGVRSENELYVQTCAALARWEGKGQRDEDS